MRARRRIGSCAGLRPPARSLCAAMPRSPRGMCCCHATEASGLPCAPARRACSKCAAPKRATNWRCRSSRPSATSGPEAVALLGAEAQEVWLSPARYGIYLYASEADVRALSPDLRALAALGDHQFICTAPGDRRDVVSRVFVPGGGVDEDSVTGSAHAALNSVLGRAAEPQQLHRAPGLGTWRGPYLSPRRRARGARWRVRDSGGGALLPARLGPDRTLSPRALRPARCSRSSPRRLRARPHTALPLGRARHRIPAARSAGYRQHLRRARLRA